MRLGSLIALLPLFAAPAVATIGSETLTSFDDLIRQGRAAYLASDLDRAESAYIQACPDSTTPGYPIAKAVTCENALASVDEARGNLARAEQRFLHAVASAEQAGAAYRPLYCAKLIDLGEHYHRQGRTADAESAFLKAVEISRGLATMQPEILPEALIRLGGLYSDSAQPERGRASLSEALALVESPKAHQSAPPVVEIALAYDSLGMIDLAAGHARTAESSLRQSVSLATAALGEDHPVTAAYQTNLALTLIDQGQFDGARLLLRRAEFVVGSGKTSPGMELAVICAEMSDVDSALGKMAEAADYAQRAISILSVQPRPDARALATAQMTLAGIYLRTHDLASAESILPAAVGIERQTTASPATLAASLQLLGQLRAQQHSWKAAEALYREALAIHERNGSANVNPALAPLLRALADVLKHEGGSKDEVRSLESQARNILRSAPAATPRA